MADIRIDTHKTDTKEKVMVDRALKNAGLEAQLQPKEEQREAPRIQIKLHMLPSLRAIHLI